MKRSNRIIEHIHKEHLKPKPKGYFVLQEILFVFGSAFMLFISGALLGSLLFQQSNQQLLPEGYVYIALVIKIIIITAAFLASLVLFRKISTLYRKSLVLHLVFLAVVIVVLGLGLFFSQSVTRFESALGHIGAQEQIQNYWSQPEEKGLLAGEFVESTASGLALIQGFSGDFTAVDVSQVKEKERNLLFDYLRVGLVGYVENGVFQVCQIHPWRVIQGGSPRHELYQQKGKEGNIFFGKASKQEMMEEFERNNPYIRSNKCEEDHTSIN